jgi:outer membrane protein assembly factor BamD
LGMSQMRDDSRRVLEKNFPQSEFLSRGFKSSSDPWWKFW